MPVAGVIAERTRAILPVTWDALSKDPRYGDDLLQDVIDFAKSNTFGTIVAPAAETAYSYRAIDYTAKIAAIELCLPGIDFWMNEPMSESATGTNENHSFTDRAAVLQALRRNLIEETRRLAGEIADEIGFRAFSPRRPLLSTIDDELLTPSPQEFPRPFAATDRS